MGHHKNIADLITPEQRRRAMAHNRGRTGPELALATELWKRGLRYFTGEGYKARKGHRLLGNPDLVFPRKHIVIFVDGCFWHGCPECAKAPTDDGFWARKVRRNVERDRRVTDELEAAGWKVIRVPEHAVRRKARLTETADALAEELRNLSRRR